MQKIYFQPDVNLDLAIAQIVSATNAIRALMPPGIQAPIVVQFNASSVPVLQISLSSDTLNEQELFDYGIYRVRQQLAPIHGVTLPTPAGGKYRQIMVDIDPAKLLAKGLTPLDVVNAVNAQNLTVPSGTAKIGDRQYIVRTNAMPPSIDELNDIPIKVANGATVFMRDVGQVHDGWAVQQNVVRRDGVRSVLLSIIKNGNASTLQVVNGVRDALKIDPRGRPAGLKIDELFDQSVFVKSVGARRAARGRDRGRSHRADDPAVSRFMALDAGGADFHSAVDPVVARGALLPRRDAQHHDARRAGARGRHPGRRFDRHDREHASAAHGGAMPLPAATLHGSAGIAVPTLVSTLAISCVFTSVIFLDGPAKYLFTPLGFAVVFAMLSSYVLSRTLTPITIGLLLRNERHAPPRAGSRMSSRACTRRSSVASSACATPTRGCSSPARPSLDHPGPGLPSWRWARPCFSWSAATSSRRSMPDRSSFTSARRPERGSRRPSASSRRSKTRFAR